MFNLGFSEMILLAAVALIFIGPQQLPGIARALGRLINEFKRTTADIVGGVKNPGQDLEELSDKLQELTEINLDVEESKKDE